MGLFSKKKEEDKQAPKKEASVKDGAKKETKEESRQSMKDLYGGAKPSTKSTKETGKKKKERVYGNAHKVLVKPLITEKATNLGAYNQYVFAVGIDSNKIEIAKAIDEVYGIKPTKVNVIKVSGKSVRYGRITGKRKNWKKAIITLPEGKTINIYEGV